MTFKEIIKMRLHRDLGFDFYIKEGSPIRDFRIIAKSSGILCGLIFVPTIIELTDKEFFLKPLRHDESDKFNVYVYKDDGCAINPGDVIAIVRGNSEVLLKAERTICNTLSRLSGIATNTRKILSEISGFETIILDTRKDDSLERSENKYAVRIGGGKNHRTGFFDGILIKDNDIAVYGGITRAVNKRLEEAKFLTRAEIEVKNMEELRLVLCDSRVDAILLDNMEPELLKQAILLIAGSDKKYLVEASGVGNYDLKEIAATGIPYISMSRLVNEARPIDISMKVL